MTEVFTKYGGGESQPKDKKAPACIVRHPEAGGQCEREAVGEVWALPFCEVHGREAELSYKEGIQETVAFGLDKLNDGGEYVMPRPILEVLKSVEYPRNRDHESVEAAMREAYPPEKLADNIDPDTLRHDYEEPSTNPVDWWTDARYKVLRFMDEAYEDCHLELLRDLELIRERATVQLLLAERDMDERWVRPRLEAKEATKKAS